MQGIKRSIQCPLQSTLCPALQYFVWHSFEQYENVLQRAHVNNLMSSFYVLPHWARQIDFQALFFSIDNGHCSPKKNEKLHRRVGIFKVLMNFSQCLDWSKTTWWWWDTRVATWISKAIKLWTCIWSFMWIEAIGESSPLSHTFMIPGGSRWELQNRRWNEGALYFRPGCDLRNNIANSVFFF